MSVTIQLRGGTAAQWTTADPVLAIRELGLETDTLAYKIGDGTSAWTALAYRVLSGTMTALLLESYDGATEPSAPSPGFLTVYGKDIAGRQMLKWRGPSGLDTPVQEALFSNAVALITPNTTSSFLPIGTVTFTAVGTVSTPTLAVGSLRLSTKRAIATSAAVANSASELRVAQTQCWRGDGAGLGGFFFSARFGASSAVAGQRLFVGLTSSTSAIATTQDPATLTNCVGVGNAAADANLQVLVNDGSGSAIKTDLGASFPVPSSSNNAMYQLDLFAAPNASVIGYRVSHLVTGSVATGSLGGAELPASTVFLAPHFYMNNNGVASSVILDFYRYYLATDT